MSIADFVAGSASPKSGEPAGANPVIAQLSALRQGLGLSLKEVGGRSTLDEVSLTDWERGAASPSLEALGQWAMSLGQRLALLPLNPEPPHGVKVHWNARHLTVHGKNVRLTPMEWSIIERLAWSPGQLVTHRQLFKHLYGTDRECRAQSTAVRVRISKLRQKLPLSIEARWGQGYVLEGIEASHSPGPVPQPHAAAEARLLPARQEPSLARPAARDYLRPSTRGDFAMLAIAPSRKDARSEMRAPQPPRTNESTPRSGAVTPASGGDRTQELGVIERFLAERGVTKCPNAGAMELAPLPSLVWDKTKRKWVRPSVTTVTTRRGA
jgi:transcriptional regulator with XRE-family HTH domain